jgi:hypothetical protein
VTASDRSEGLLAKLLDLSTLSLLAAMLAKTLEDPARINHDCASLLMGAVMVHEGRMPLSALFGTVNPPMTGYMNLLLVRTASWLSVNVILVYLLFVYLVVVFSVVSLRRLLVRGGVIPQGTAAAAGVFWAWVSWVPFTQGDFNFGQRDHLFVLVIVPFLVGRWLRWEEIPVPRATQILLGVMAGLGTCLKPYYMLIPLVVEGVWLLRKRAWRPIFSADLLAYVGTGAAFVGHLFLLPEEIRAAFFGALSPGVRYYGAYVRPWSVLWARESIRFALLAGAVGLALGAWRKAAMFRLVEGLAAASIVAAGLYFYQRHGWSYRAYPAFGLSVLTSVLIVAGPVGFWSAVAGPFRNPSPGLAVFRKRTLWAARLAAVVVAGTAVIALVNLVRNGVVVTPSSHFERTFAELSRPKEEILFLSTTVWPMYPTMLRFDRRPFHRYWGPLANIAFYQAGLEKGPGGYPYRRWEEMSLEERTFLEDLGREIRNGHPSLIVVAAGPVHQGCPEGFSLEEYLRRVPPVAEALAGYAPVAKLWKHLYLRPKEWQPAPPGPTPPHSPASLP